MEEYKAKIFIQFTNLLHLYLSKYMFYQNLIKKQAKQVILKILLNFSRSHQKHHFIAINFEPWHLRP